MAKFMSERKKSQDGAPLTGDQTERWLRRAQDCAARVLSQGNTAGSFYCRSST